MFTLKQVWALRTDAALRMVTQFGLDAQTFTARTDWLLGRGIDLPVHLGSAAPAKVTTRLKYAVQFDIGNSLEFLRKRGTSLVGLVSHHSPEDFVAPIENHWRSNPAPIAQLNVFPFGGMRRTSTGYATGAFGRPPETDSHARVLGDR